MPVPPHARAGVLVLDSVATVGSTARLDKAVAAGSIGSCEIGSPRERALCALAVAVAFRVGQQRLSPRERIVRFVLPPARIVHTRFLPLSLIVRLPGDRFTTGRATARFGGTSPQQPPGSRRAGLPDRRRRRRSTAASPQAGPTPVSASGRPHRSRRLPTGSRSATPKVVAKGARSRTSRSARAPLNGARSHSAGPAGLRRSRGGGRATRSGCGWPGPGCCRTR
jgi:hypothetical protein